MGGEIFRTGLVEPFIVVVYVIHVTPRPDAVVRQRQAAVGKDAGVILEDAQGVRSAVVALAVIENRRIDVIVIVREHHPKGGASTGRKLAGAREAFQKRQVFGRSEIAAKQLALPAALEGLAHHIFAVGLIEGGHLLTSRTSSPVGMDYQLVI